ncbi:hypothetical protein LRP30_32785 [Bradyrhizobium sp. C-145]|uniref:CmcJ/NvfI family oxidoreductase n=1 Tax=Bradyrhizobium sp. C-145 TaxID=574727 RepID=UPI00201B8FC8|nr:CmcJ/NvfI family oxidoreductase [Bradyrhizobium sp. C-145]UQR61568.1 hypothetical protein LRP30_32785 [Bradyrhizobium sp. C-145]
MENAKSASPTVEANRDSLECVQGQINFARRTSDEKAPEVAPRSFPKMLIGHLHDPPPFFSYDVTIRNARPIVNRLSLDREGFTLIQNRRSCVDKPHQETMCDRYLQEMVPFIKNRFNASWVVARREAVVCRSAAGGNSTPTVKEPIVLAHIDYAPTIGPLAAAAASQSQGVPIQSYSRLLIIQTWHALSPPPQDFPLAMCDNTSLYDTDIEVVDYTVFGNTIKMGIVHFNEAQRWYYFPEMTADELILFKSYDSEVRCNSKAAHSAFDNRRAHPGAKPRESLEARFFVYYT